MLHLFPDLYNIIICIHVYWTLEFLYFHIWFAVGLAAEIHLLWFVVLLLEVIVLWLTKRIAFNVVHVQKLNFN